MINKQIYKQTNKINKHKQVINQQTNKLRRYKNWILWLKADEKHESKGRNS